MAATIPGVRPKGSSAAGSFLTGEVKIYAGPSEPSGWLYCAGQAVSRSTYAALFAVIGTAFGAGDGSTTFNLPDLRGRVPVGRDDMNGSDANRVTSGGSGIDGNALGAAGGAETHTLTTAQLPSHAHQQTYDDAAGGAAPQGASYYGGAGGASVGGMPSAYANGSGGASNIDTVATGSGSAHQNMPPAQILNYIIKT